MVLIQKQHAKNRITKHTPYGFSMFTKFAQVKSKNKKKFP